MFSCLIYLLLFTSHWCLGQIVLNTSYTTQGKSRCADPLMPLLMSDPSKAYYGCCGSKAKTTMQSMNRCCLLAGSACDPMYKSSPQPCKGAPCCASDIKGGGSTSIVRLSAGTVLDKNLRQAVHFSIARRDNDRQMYLVLNQAPSDDDSKSECKDKDFPISMSGKFQNVPIEGCCQRKPTNAYDSASACCLVAGSNCDGTIPCCSNRGCILGKCPPDSGLQTDTSVSGYCRYYDSDYTQPMKPSIAYLGKASIGNAGRECRDSVLSKYVEFSVRGGAACCRSKLSDINNASLVQSNCCLIRESPCDGAIDCCSGLPCCGGRCPKASGDFPDKKVLNYPQPIC